MKSHKKPVLFMALTLLWTLVIFSFSLQPAQASANLSGGLLQHLLDWFYRLTGLQIPTYFAHVLIRKTAHFVEFFLLGVFSYQTSRHWFSKWYPALLYGALVAVTDEYIQHCTGGGRAMLVSDMILDTCGVAAAIGVMLLIVKLSKNKKHKNSKNKGKNV